MSLSCLVGVKIRNKKSKFEIRNNEMKTCE